MYIKLLSMAKDKRREISNQRYSAGLKKVPMIFAQKERGHPKILLRHPL